MPRPACMHHTSERPLFKCAQSFSTPYGRVDHTQHLQSYAKWKHQLSTTQIISYIKSGSRLSNPALTFFLVLSIFRYNLAEVSTITCLSNLMFTLGKIAFLLMTMVSVFFTLTFMQNSFPALFARVAIRCSLGSDSAVNTVLFAYLRLLTFLPPIETPSSGWSDLNIISVNRLKRFGDSTHPCLGDSTHPFYLDILRIVLSRSNNG